MPVPLVRVLVAFSTNPSDPVPEWVDVTGDVRPWESPISIGLTGRSSELGSSEPAESSFGLSNPDGRYTWGNASSPYYPNVRPRRRVRIQVSPDGVSWFDRFDGLITEWPVSWAMPEVGGDAMVGIRAVDRLLLMGSKRRLRHAMAEELGTSSGQDSGWTLGSLLPYEGAPAWTADSGYPDESLYPAEDLYPTEA